MWCNASSISAAPLKDSITKYTDNCWHHGYKDSHVIECFHLWRIFFFLDFMPDRFKPATRYDAIFLFPRETLRKNPPKILPIQNHVCWHSWLLLCLSRNGWHWTAQRKFVEEKISFKMIYYRLLVLKKIHWFSTGISGMECLFLW